MAFRSRTLHGAIAAMCVAVGTMAASTAIAGTSSTTVAPALSAGQTKVAAKFAAPFAGLAGSQDNAVALATALRTGTTAELVYTTTSATGDSVQTTVDITVPIQPMGWGNVSHALALAQYALQQAGVTNPTAADLQAALNGGTVTAADGTTVTLTGVLQQRASGVGWGRIAQSYGTTMGAVNRGLHAPATSVVSGASGSTTSGTTAGGTTTAAEVDDGGPKTITTATGASAGSNAAHGLTTASGAIAGGGAGTHADRGMTTAAGATGGTSSGVVTASGGGAGNGNALGRGMVTAAGGPASGAVAAHGGMSGIVTGSGSAASPIANAGSGNGQGGSVDHGRGKGKGGG